MVYFHQSQKGEKAKLAQMACENACERSRLETVKEVHANSVIVKLASMLSLEVVPSRIESYDISNIGAEHKTCGMIVIENGSFKKKDYLIFGTNIVFYSSAVLLQLL